MPLPTPVAARSNAKVCGRLIAGIAGLNPTWGMDVYLLCLYVVLSCVGRGLCDGLITRPEESYRVSLYV
jgi:phage shock protein PspC (stress-responsive transcriptional regulator)